MERRKATRYPLWEYRYEIYDNDNNAIGWIIDISDGGLSFEYIPASIEIGKSSLISIFPKQGNGSYLPDIQCKRVYDIKIEDEDIYHIPVEFRRCGVKLIALLGEKKKRFRSIVEDIKTTR
jgi:hypothetical protein